LWHGTPCMTPHALHGLLPCAGNFLIPAITHKV